MTTPINVSRDVRIFHQVLCDLNESYSIIIEDDGRVAYAYLYEIDNIIGDVWLYNQDVAPQDVNWNIGEMPFLNPIEFIIDNIVISPLQSDDEINCEWKLSYDIKQVKEVIIFLEEI